MKKIFTMLFAIAFTATQAQHKLIKLWETDSLAVPESVLPAHKENFLYTSLINGGATDVDGNGSIAKVNLNGKIINAQWAVGLNAPKGLGKWGNKLYVADLKEVAVINTLTGKIERKIQVAGSVFLNDVTVDNKGLVYVSDTRVGKVYRIKDNKAEVWLNNIADANGLKAIGTDLYILSGTKLIKVNQNKEIQTVAEGFAKNGDGLEQLKNGDFVVSCWNGLVYYVSSNGKVELLLDNQNSKINTADIGLNTEKNIIYIPTFNHKSIIAYQLSKK